MYQGKKRITKVLCAAIVLSMFMGLTGCGKEGNSENLMQGYRGQKHLSVTDFEEVVALTTSEDASDKTDNNVDVGTDVGSDTNVDTGNKDSKIALVNPNAEQMTDFAVRLFQQSLEEDRNTLISPLSVISALGMTANGAAGETLSQMEQTFGMPMAELNEYLYTYREGLPEDKDSYKLSLANAIWFKDVESLAVKEDFLQTNADYYDATICKAPFDDTTVADINNWVSDNTDGMISNILDRIPDTSVMYLINALCFDAKWQQIYMDYQVRETEFTKEDGTKQNIEIMYSGENAYLQDDNAIGFMKYYVDKKYAFAALLPNEGIGVTEYVNSLTGEKLHNILTGVSQEQINAGIPKFKSEYCVEMSEVLQAMGMTDAFDSGAADFSAMGFSANGSLYINQVIHKTFIQVDEQGTKAGAATMVAMAEGCAPMEIKEIYLDRPFVYMIVDCENDIPVFLGVVREIQE